MGSTSRLLSFASASINEGLHSRAPRQGKDGNLQQVTPPVGYLGFRVYA